MTNNYENSYASISEEADINYLNSLPFGTELMVAERIVCSANKYTLGDDDPIILLGVRHCCLYMNDHFGDLFCLGCNLDDYHEVQGFVTNRHRFVDRQEAWKIALSQRQIIRRVGGDTSKGGTLYSENLY